MSSSTSLALIRRLSSSCSTSLKSSSSSTTTVAVIPPRHFSSKSTTSGTTTATPKKSKEDLYEENYEKRDLDVVLRALDAPMRKPPDASPEEMKRRHHVGRNYVIGCFRQHNQENHDLQCKITLKLHAVKLLPKQSKIKEAALVISDEPPPAWRKIPTWTPPIEGFDPEEYMQKGEF